MVFHQSVNLVEHKNRDDPYQTQKNLGKHIKSASTSVFALPGKFQQGVLGPSILYFYETTARF
jgi:hypothetical protein